MGRTHSNAFAKVGHFFDLDREVVLVAVCGRDARQGRGPCRDLGLRGGRDRLAQAGRARRHRPHRHRQPQRHPRRDRHRRGAGRQDGDVREAARTQRRRVEAHGRGGREAGVPTWSGTTTAAFPAVTLGQAADRRGQARPDLPLPRQVPAGLDHLQRPAAGRRRPLAARRQRGGQRRHRRPARPLHRHRDVAQRRIAEVSRHDRDLHQGAPCTH